MNTKKENILKLEKTGASESGVFTIKEYMAEGEIDFISLIRMLQAGSCVVQEVVSYVFEGEDPLGLDARSFSAEDFIRMYPEMRSYGKGLAFDVIILADGHPVTVELTEGEPVIATNSLDKEVELPDLLVPEPDHAAQVSENESAVHALQVSENEPTDHVSSVSENDPADHGSQVSESEPANHARKMAVAAMLLCGRPEFEKVDMDLVLRMCLLHGFASDPDQNKAASRNASGRDQNSTAAGNASGRDQDSAAAGNASNQGQESIAVGDAIREKDLQFQNGPVGRSIEEAVRLLDQPEWRDQPAARRVLEEMRRPETAEAQVYRALDGAVKNRTCGGS